MKYIRQQILPYFRSDTQDLLASAKVLVIGCGGLASTVLPYLCAAGVGTISIVDDDVIHLDNLHRQTLFGVGDIGKKKVQVAATQLQTRYPDVHLIVYDTKCDESFAQHHFTDYDIIVETTDSIANKLLVDAMCQLLKKPLVYGAVYQYEGQMSVFHYGDEDCSLRAIFGEMDSSIQLPTCAESGVWPTLVGMIGLMQANEVLKIITHIGEVQSGVWTVYDALNNNISKLKISPNHSHNQSKAIEVNNKKSTSNNLTNDVIFHLEKNDLFDRNAIIISLDERLESKPINGTTVQMILPYELEDFYSSFENATTIICTCISGINSQAVAIRLHHSFPNKKIIATSHEILLSLYEREKP